MNTGLYGNPAAKEFASQRVAMVAGLLINTPHGLLHTPRVVRGVMVMGLVTELGYAAGDEVDVGSTSGVDSGGTRPPSFSWGANSAIVFASLTTLLPLVMNHKTTGVSTTVTAALWTFKLYAR